MKLLLLINFRKKDTLTTASTFLRKVTLWFQFTFTRFSKKNRKEKKNIKSAFTFARVLYSRKIVKTK